MTARWYVLDINPEQWRIGTVSPGRRNGKVFARVSPDHQLQGYQEAVKELLEDTAQLTPGEVTLTLVFWRQREEYTTDSQRKQRRHEADLTNLQKGLEDALQDVLIENDRNVREIHSYIAEQNTETTGCVAIKVEPWKGFDPSILPEHVWLQVDFVRSPDAPHQQEIL